MNEAAEARAACAQGSLALLVLTKLPALQGEQEEAVAEMDSARLGQKHMAATVEAERARFAGQWGVGCRVWGV